MLGRGRREGESPWASGLGRGPSRAHACMPLTCVPFRDEGLAEGLALEAAVCLVAALLLV